MKVPKYRKHASGQAIVWLNGKDHYLGPHGSEESKNEYRRLLISHLGVDHTGVRTYHSLRELYRQYLEHARDYYHGSNEAEQLEFAIRPLIEAYGDVRVDAFRPAVLISFRDRMEVTGRTRQGINKQMSRIRRMVKWGVTHELVPASVLDAIATLPPLRRGRTAAPESEPITAVSDDDLQATIQHAPIIIGDMINVQLLTACRPGELVGMTRRQIDTTGEVWCYRPVKHKNQWRDQGREIQIGPRAQQIMRDYLPTGLDVPLFSPRRFHSNAKFRQQYDVRQYRKSIWAACDNAGIPRWSPNQLRHSRATEIRAKYGVEGAQHVLGHATIDATQIYAERSRDQAIEIARSLG